MPAVIGVISEEIREAYSKYQANAGGSNLTRLGLTGSFVIGEGGWRYTVPPTKVARTPDATLTDLDCIVDVTRPPASQRYAADERFSFAKNFVASDVIWVAPSIVQCSCLVDFGEANNDGFGNFPEFWELGVFDGLMGAGNMIAYWTFPKEEKNPGVQVFNVAQLIW